MKHVLPRYWREGHIHIDLIGVGGTGSQVLTGLARLHLAIRALGGYGLKVRAFDPDTVSEANIGRQLFAPSDVGLHKCDVLIHRLNMYFGLDWEAFPVRYGAESAEESRRAGEAMIGQLVITCVDSAKARRDVQKFLHTRADAPNMYWLDCGNSRQSGQVFLTQLSTAVRAQWPRLPALPFWLPEIFDESIPEDDAPSCSLAEALENQDLFINQAIATWALHLLWSFIREGGLDVCGYWISLESGMVAPVAIPEAATVKGRRKVGTNG
jgi:PRTRC genetic system ThiF family protein